MSKNVDKKRDSIVQTRSRLNQTNSAEPAIPKSAVRTSKRATKLLTPVKRFLKANRMDDMGKEDVPCKICQSNEAFCCKSGDQVTQDWLQCDYCDSWLHGIKCEKLEVSSFLELINKDKLYKCSECAADAVQSAFDTLIHDETPKEIPSDGVKEILRQMKEFRKEVKEDNTQLRSELGVMDLRLNSCEAKIANIEANLVFKNKDEFNETIGPLIKQSIDSALKEYDISNQQEAYQQRIRRKRILISNIPVTAVNDKQFVVDFARVRHRNLFRRHTVFL